MELGALMEGRPVSREDLVAHMRGVIATESGGVPVIEMVAEHRRLCAHCRAHGIMIALSHLYWLAIVWSQVEAMVSPRQ